MLFTMLTSKPWRKYLPGAYRAIRNAQMIKIANQQKGSTDDGITNTVANPMAKPNNDNKNISFQFIGFLQFSFDAAHPGRNLTVREGA